MRRTWEALHESLTRRANSLDSHQTFNTERQRWVELEPFEHPAAVVDFLNDKAGDRDHKDRVYATLVEVSQAEGKMCLATALLVLGLWPGLDAIYRRNLKHHRNDPGELVSEIWDRFVTAVGRADLGRINRVAATLIRNTERLVGWWRQRGWNEDAIKNELPEDDCLTRAEGSEQRPDISDLGLPPGLSFEQEAARLQAAIAKAVGDDANLVIGTAVYGESHREAGERLGLSHANARKRYQRAVNRLRAQLKKNDEVVSQFGDANRVSSSVRE